MQKDLVWETQEMRKQRHSLDYYKWLLNVCEKRNIESITVAFSKTKFGTWQKEDLIKRIKGE